jgi:ferredoxin
MKVEVNHDRCEGHGKCVIAAPGIFELRDDDLSYVLVDEVPAEQRERVDRAIRLCPRQAIAWVSGS